MLIRSVLVTLGTEQNQNFGNSVANLIHTHMDAIGMKIINFSKKNTARSLRQKLNNHAVRKGDLAGPRIKGRGKWKTWTHTMMLKASSLGSNVSCHWSVWISSSSVFSCQMIIFIWFIWTENYGFDHIQIFDMY